MSYGEERLYCDEARNKALKRQADALETLAEQVEIQNALLLQQNMALERLVSVQFRGNPDDAPRTASLASNTESFALDLRERVDLDAVGRVADE